MFSITPTHWCSLTLLFAALAWPHVGQAQTSFGNFAGDTVVYDDVTENSGGLFGAPSISGDTLDFSSGLSTSFEADSVGGTPDATGGSITTEISAQPQKSLTEIEIEAGGFLQLLRFGGALTADTSVEATISIDVQVLEVAGASLPTAISLAPTSKVFVQANLADDGLITSPVGWNDVLEYDVVSAAAAQGITQPITRIAVDINTTLKARSVSTTRSIIALRAFDTLTLTVPEPTSLSLLAVCSVLLVRRK